jgi:hypothetical protein
VLAIVAADAAAARVYSRFSVRKAVKGKLESVICKLTRGKLPTSGNNFITNEAKI